MVSFFFSFFKICCKSHIWSKVPVSLLVRVYSSPKDWDTLRYKKIKKKVLISKSLAYYFVSKLSPNEVCIVHIFYIYIFFLFQRVSQLFGPDLSLWVNEESDKFLMALVWQHSFEPSTFESKPWSKAKWATPPKHFIFTSLRKNMN